jgi:MFS family permease
MSSPHAENISAHDASLLAFYRNMGPSERRTFWACSGGWILDATDFMIYPLVIGTIIKLWNVDAGLAGLALTVALLSSALGGWLAGFLADRIGRVRTLQITILWFSICSVLCGLACNFTELVMARALLGLGFGGEWTAGAILLGEAVGAPYRGRAVGTMQAGWAVGWGMAILMQAVLFSVLPPESAWRWMFLAGGVPALLVLCLRRSVNEPDVSVRARSRQSANRDRASIFNIFSPQLLRTTVLASMFSAGCQGGYYAIIGWLPRFLTSERKLSVVDSTGYLAILVLGSFLGYLAGAWLADRIGRRNTFLVFSVGAIAIVILYTQAPLYHSILWMLGFPLGFFSCGYYAGIGAFLTELYPTHLRGSGQGFCYNFGRGIGAVFPALVGFLSARMSVGSAIAIFAVAAYVLLLACAFALPETRGRILR